MTDQNQTAVAPTAIDDETLERVEGGVPHTIWAREHNRIAVHGEWDVSRVAAPDAAASETPKANGK